MLGNFEYGLIFWRDEKIYDIREDVNDFINEFYMIHEF